MSRSLVVVLIAVAAIGLGVTAALLGRRGGDTAEDLARRPRRTESSRDAGFHVGMEPADRRAQARASLRKLTSATAQSLGDHKDDIALLADDEGVIDEILEAYAGRASLTRYEAAAFVDLFERVRHPRFVEPLRRLMGHEDRTVRSKTIPAALTQADPTLTPPLDRLYQEMLRDYPGQGAYTRARILTAAAACGGAHLPVLLDRGFEDADAEVRVRTCVITVEHGGLGLEGRLRQRLEDEEPVVRYYAGWALLSLGRSGGEEAVLEALRSPDDRLATVAMDAVARLGWDEAIPVLEARLASDEVSRDVVVGASLALARLAHLPTLARLDALARRDDVSVDDLRLAAAGLAATGDPLHWPRLRQLVERGGRALAGAVDSGLALAPPGDVDLALARAMIDVPGLHPGEVMSLLERAGEALLPLLRERIATAEETGRLAALAACVGQIGTPAARALLVDSRDRHPRVMDEQIRAVDLALRRRGTPR